MDRAVPAALGGLLVVFGNFMGKLTRNFFVGIRTPWTLASEEVWLRTHRLGGKVIVLAGLGLVLSSALGGGFVFVIAAIALVAVIPIVYSYVLYRRLEGFRDGPPDGDPADAVPQDAR
ncbi:MAG: SdpI family protein [Kofleriaceae bacterium]